jgi:hypothetical protein
LAKWCFIGRGLLWRAWNWFGKLNKEFTFYKQIHLTFWSQWYVLWNNTINEKTTLKPQIEFSQDRVVKIACMLMDNCYCCDDFPDLTNTTTC